MKDTASSVKVGVADNNLTRGGHILHEQEYNTGHGLQTIPNEVRRKVRRQPRQPEIQQKPVVHLLLEAALGRECGVPGLPVQTASQPPQPAHGGRAKAHPRYAPPQSVAGHDRAVAPSAEARLHPLPGESVPCHA